MPGRLIRVRGQVQGVGFRPFVWQLARVHGVTGDVLNDPEGVLIRAWGPDLEAFIAAIPRDAPPLAKVDAVEASALEGDAPGEFRIAPSAGSGAETRVTPDAATCPSCLEEIRDPEQRRHGYAFANCTHCGPRFTILNDLPYDRAKTSMAVFEMCDACRSEYENPADRRFHAQPIACADCGPAIWIEDASGKTSTNVIDTAAELLSRCKILAIKGLGGFHLACDAGDPDAIALLRDRKRRPGKPLALMATEDMIMRHAAPDPAALELLRSSAAPIVLLDKAGVPLPEGLAPGQSCLGWMLPYTPLHHLLMDSFGGPLVMTSGNLSGEPQVIGNAEARDKLAGFADAFLMHNRDIARRLDDSVMRLSEQGPVVLRHARGRVPGTMPLPDGFDDAPQIVAYGGQMKSAICLIKNGQALPSHHLGDLDDLLTVEEFEKADRDYRDLFDHRPEVAACDLHPDFRSSQHARQTGLPVVAVQHHHAHLAACLGENGWPGDGGKVAGIILDGLGLGPDDTVWGGEILLGDYTGYQRRHWLAPAPLVGGDKAQQEPWRNALVRLDNAGLADWADTLFYDAPRAVLRQAAMAGLNAPLSSSAGRLFDAVAACLGLCAEAQSFEGEAAMRLEGLAEKGLSDEGYEFAIDGSTIDPAPMFVALRHDLAAGVTTARVSARFHTGLAHAFADAARTLVEDGEAEAVALSGGCFQNAYLLDLTCRMLKDVPVLTHAKVPTNDGGLALGQALIAARQAVSA